MVVQYPHMIKVTPTPKAVAPAQARDGHGNWQAQAPAAPVFFRGRYENISARRNSSFKSSGGLATDGNSLKDMGIIYAPLGTPDVPQGAALEVQNGDSTVATGKCGGFLPGQLNCLVWLQA